MERRDYIVDQIHELGLFIAKLIGRFQNSIDLGGEDKLFDTAKDELSVQFGWDLDDLLFMDERSFVSLMDENLLVDEHFENMSKVFEILGDHAIEHQTLLRKEIYYQKALLLLNYIEHKSNTYSMERRDRIAQINNKLNL